jgi:hypothetical protein
LGLRAQSEGILVGAREAVPAGDFLGKRRDEAFAIHGDAKGGADAVEEFGYVERRWGLLEYVIGHINLRQTYFAGRTDHARVSVAEASDGAELGVQRCFKYGEDGFLKIVVHGGLLSMG